MTIEEYLDQFIENAIKEDVGDGDHTSLSCIPASEKGRMHLIIKQNGILAGVEVALRVFQKIDKDIKLRLFLPDGSEVKKGDIVLEVEGKVQSLLLAERLVLNIMQRMSGIATKTSRYVSKLKGLKTKVLDTRKTTPGMRLLEKAAVKIGGAQNHRIGLYDMILIKDNHIDFAGGIEQAINKTNEYLKAKNKNLKIEIEARTIQDVEKIIEVGHIDRILLDNFSIENTRKAVSLINGCYETESSGMITLDTIRDYAECGVDFVSVGALTHHIESLDMSLKAF
ncbi:MAG: carboxylating nicotinate-nucleotide diphosphorylase [Bacteroidota bacterium]|nr:carboxylating nicotinate-nucleotide diphosphorylase [Bacteroidota bacterium]MDP4226914.1 carboxylating nicotinate-nucleotide diphosphorylase [Bacteroidota bacterium]